MLSAGDRVALAALEAALADARAAQDQRPALVVLSAALTDLGVRPAARPLTATLLPTCRDEWLARLRSARRSDSTLRAYRNAIDDLLTWAHCTSHTDDLFEERTIVAHLDDYRQRRQPAPATYHRRFLLLRNFMRWISRRHGVWDPFLDLQAPPKPHHHGDWLSPDEFARLLNAASNPPRRRQGLGERDRLVLLTLVTTGLRRSELIGLDWRDFHADEEHPSLLVRHGKGDRPRRQPLPRHLAAELSAIRGQREALHTHPVFCGLAGRRLQPGILAAIIRRASARAGLEKHVTAHTLRHTAATWLRQGASDTRLVAEYLGHADLSTVSRYAHVARKELHQAATDLGALAGIAA